MKTIISRANPLYRQWLSQHKLAGRQGNPVWLEGIHLCQAWLEAHDQPSWGIFNQAAAQHPETIALAHRVSPAHQIWMPEKLIKGISSLISAPPVIFLVSAPEHDHTTTLEQNCLLLDDVQDPGNVGAMLRTAAAAGIRQVHASAGTAACWSPKVLRAGQGAHFALEIHEGQDLEALLLAHRGRKQRLPVLVTCLDPSAQSIFEVQLPSQAVWVFGHEGRGASPEITALSDQRLYIEHDTRAVESLNVASAAAVCLFEQRRQSKSGPKH